MKKLLFLAVPLLLFGVANSQAITDTGTLRAVINAEIVTNGTKAITAPKVNRILNGFLNVWPNLNNLVPTSRIITINGVSHNLATNPSWSFPVGGGGGIDSTDTITVDVDSLRMAYFSHYQLNDSTIVWVRINGGLDTLHLHNYGGGSGGVVSEVDPVYSASSWFSTTNNSSNWNTAYSKYVVSGAFSGTTMTFTRNDATTFNVTGLRNATIATDQTVTVATNGQTSFTFTGLPASTSAITVDVNGGVFPASSLSITGNVLTISATDLQAGSKINVHFK